VFLVKGNRKKVFPSLNKFVVILFALILSLVVVAAFADENQLSLSPISPEFQEYMDLVQAREAPSIVTAEGYYLGLIPAPVDMSHTRGLSVIPEVKRVFYPVSYDLRTLGRVTPVKDQGACGSCWAFATYGSLESWILEEEGITWDFSENNLKNCHGFDWTGCAGGNRWLSTAYLARRDGPINEADDPYRAYEDACIPGLSEKKYLETVLFIPDRASSTDNNNIKQAVMDYGMMYTSMYYASSYYNATNHTYYYNGTASSNHAVAIVGWDDNFNKNLFNTPPPGDGAWIVRNSWGTTWGESGYFYISYYDSKTGRSNASFVNAEEPDDSIIYQYDPLGSTTFAYVGGAGNTKWGANIFTATSNKRLTSVAFYAATVNTSYGVYIYDTFFGGSFSDLLGSKSGTVTYPGYHTIDLDSSVRLTSGDDFAVVVKFTTPGYNWPIPIEYPISGYSDAATANPGESYASSDGTSWTDITSIWSNTNVCIKAIARIVLPSPNLTGLVVYPNPLESAKGHTGVTFQALTEEVIIRIFALSGELVRKAELAFQYSWDWDGKNMNGEDLARGIYIWVVTNTAGEEKSGKIAVLK